MTIALSTLLDGFTSFISDKVVESAADSGDTEHFIDALLGVYPDGYFDDYYVYITSGNAEGDVRRVETFTKTTKKIEPYVDFSGAVGAGDTYQLKKTNTQDAIDALNNALISITNRPDPRTGRKYKLYRWIVFTDLGHSLLTSNAAADPNKDVIVADESLFFVGQKLTLKDDTPQSEDCVIASITAGTHTLTMEDALTNAYTTANNAEIFAKSGKYFNVGATLGVSRITGLFLQADSTSQRNPYREYSVVYTSAGVKQIYFPTAISVDDQTWIVEAIGALESVSAVTDPVTLDSERVDLLYAETAYHFYRRQADDISAGDYERMEALSQKYKNMVDIDLRGLWMPLPRERISLKTDSDYD